MSKLKVFATAVSELAMPASPVLVALLYACLRLNSSIGRAFSQWVIASAFSVAVPMAYVLFAVRTGRASDHHVSNRRDRLVPICVAALSSGAGLLVLREVDCPTSVLRLYDCGVALLIAIGLITLYWKVSAHMAVYVGALVSVAIIVTIWSLALMPIALIIGWARVHLRAHSLAQVVAGSVLGAAVPIVVTQIL